MVMNIADEKFERDLIDNRARSVAHLFIDRVAKSGQDEAYRFPQGGAWKSMTWAQTDKDVRAIAARIRALDADRTAVMRAAEAGLAFAARHDFEREFTARTDQLKAIWGPGGAELDEAAAPAAVTIALNDEIDIVRGEMLAHADAQPKRGTELSATVCWFADDAETILQAQLAIEAVSTTSRRVSPLGRASSITCRWSTSPRRPRYWTKAMGSKVSVIRDESLLIDGSTQRRTDRRRGVGLAGLHLQLDVTDNFLCHLSTLRVLAPVKAPHRTGKITRPGIAF